jgi:hypothetical protein
MRVAPAADEVVPAADVVVPAANSLPVILMSALPTELLQHIVKQASNVLEPCSAVCLSSASKELHGSTEAVRQQLQADHEEVLALCLKVGMRSCKQLREAKAIDSRCKGLSAADVALLGTLGSVLPALQSLTLFAGKAGLEGVQRLAAGLVAGALPAVTCLSFVCTRVDEAGTSALAAALDRGALPRLATLNLSSAAIGDAGLVALAPALRRLPALEHLILPGNPLGDAGLAALVPPPPAAGAPHPPNGGLTKLKLLNLSETRVTDASCTTLASVPYSRTLPALERVVLSGTPAGGAARAAVKRAYHGAAEVARPRSTCRLE